MVLTVGSLFSGIGGIDLGLERAGMESRWFVEWDAHCQNVLRRHWPGLPIYGDITAVDWSSVEPVDVLAGGFPCQPVSGAGRRQAQADARWLWPQFARAIGDLRPRYVLVENVSDLLAINRGSAMGDVLGDLATLGYDAEWESIPANAVGALHERDRVWIVAYPSSDPREIGDVGDEERNADPSDAERVRHEPAGDGAGRGARSMADADSISRHERRASDAAQEPRRRDADRGSKRQTLAYPAGVRPSGPWEPVESVYPTANRPWQAGEPLDGRLASQWATEPDVGRVADGIPHRVDRLRSLGNAVVPQVVEFIGRRIVAFDERAEVAA